jgi:hypothetical protein
MVKAPLTPYAAEWLEVRCSCMFAHLQLMLTKHQMEKTLGGRSVLKGTIDEQRAQFNGLGAALGPSFLPLPDVLDTEDVMITSTLRVRVYTPKGKSDKLPFAL